MTPEEANQLQKHLIHFAGWYLIQPAIRVSNNIVFVTHQKEDTECVLAWCNNRNTTEQNFK